MDGLIKVVVDAIGFVVLGLSVVVKLPQIVKIYKAESGAGISKLGNLFELAAYTIGTAYPVFKEFPFLAFGEFAFLAIQTVVVIAMILYYDQNYWKVGLFLGIYVAISVVLLIGVLGNAVMTTLQAIAAALGLIGKLAQVKKNYVNKHTGQLSNSTMYILTFMGVVRIFTASVGPQRDFILIANFIGLTVANVIIVYQIFIYRENTKKFKKVDALSVFERKSKSLSGSQSNKNKTKKRSRNGNNSVAASLSEEGTKEGYQITAQDMEEAAQDFQARLDAQKKVPGATETASQQVAPETATEDVVMAKNEPAIESVAANIPGLDQGNLDGLPKYAIDNYGTVGREPSLTTP